MNSLCMNFLENQLTSIEVTNMALFVIEDFEHHHHHHHNALTSGKILYQSHPP